MRKYSMVSGAYVFPADDCQVQVRNVSRDRFGRIYGDLAILTVDGMAYLAKDSGCLSQGDYRRRVASQAASRNSGDTLRVENLLMDCLLALEQNPTIADTTPGPAPLSVREWLRTVRPPALEVVAGLLERGGLYLVSAKPKAGKTILLLNLALSVAQGTTWLGRAVTPGKVVMFQLEDSDRILKRRLERMVRGAWPDDLWLQVTPFRLTLDNYDATVQACRGASLVLCDPIIPGIGGAGLERSAGRAGRLRPVASPGPGHRCGGGPLRPPPQDAGDRWGPWRAASRPWPPWTESWSSTVTPT